MSKNVIFCYSASGNCMDIAKNIASRMHDTDIISLRYAPVKTDVTDAETVGFVFPCYAGGLPGHVEEYVRALRVSEKAYTYGICSCAAYPGVGLAKIHEMIPLDFWAVIPHICSCIWLFPPITMPPASIAGAEKRSEKLTAEAALHITCRHKSEKAPTAPLLNKLESSAWPKLAPLKAKKMRVSDQCVGCGQCMKLCSQANIQIIQGKAVIGRNCIGCLSCLQYCPKEAISLGGVTLKRRRYHNANVSAQEMRVRLTHID